MPLNFSLRHLLANCFCRHSWLLCLLPLLSPQLALSSVCVFSFTLDSTPQVWGGKSWPWKKGRRKGYFGELAFSSRRVSVSRPWTVVEPHWERMKESARFSSYIQKNPSLSWLYTFPLQAGASPQPLPSTRGVIKHRFLVCGTQDTLLPT